MHNLFASLGLDTAVHQHLAVTNDQLGLATGAHQALELEDLEELNGFFIDVNGFQSVFSGSASN